MKEANNIIIGNKATINIFYSMDGVYTENTLSVSGRYITEALSGYQYLHIGEDGLVDCYELDKCEDKALRLTRYLGKSKSEQTSDSMKIKTKANTLIIYETQDINKQKLITEIKKFTGNYTKIIYIMLKNDRENCLLKHLTDNNLDNLTVITNAEVLRNQGMDIAFGLSWENAVSDLVWQIYADNELRVLANKGKIIVRFGTEGALRFNNKPKESDMILYYDPHTIEGDLLRNLQGFVYDVDALFAIQIIMAMEKDEDIDDAIGNGLDKINTFSEKGYYIDGEKLQHSTKSIKESNIQKVGLFASDMNRYSNNAWSLLSNDEEIKLESLARNVVIYGNKTLHNIPSAKFGYLVTIDKNEIERFRTVRNLLEEYLSKDNPKRPLSIAVFGAPGSGKSFGVTQIAKCLDSRRIEKVEFNLSQMQSDEELMHAFKTVQGLVLEGKIPLVFFDEFDCDKRGRALDWLKSFLAPMQDGEFYHKGRNPIGKCIFIFAGGVFNSFDEFSVEQKNTSAKVRDFISRLRGFVNIQGPNRSSDTDTAYIMRRAVLIRSLIERKLRNILSKDGIANIDEDIIRAMLRVPEYRHGVRSMEAIMDMSMLTGKSFWDKSSLPPIDQLAIHVDNLSFNNLLLVNKLLASYREAIAKSIHNNYLESITEQKNKKADFNQNNCSWDELNEGLKEENRKQADSYIDKLFSIQCSIEPIGISLGDFAFTESEVEHLAKKEHDRWMSSIQQNGWAYGKVKDVDKKTNPFIVPWEELDEDARKLDRDPIRNILVILKDADIGIYRVR